MTISSFRIESVIRLYTRQNNAKCSPSPSGQDPDQPYGDRVTLVRETDKTEAFEKISYSLLDIILKNRDKK